MYPTERVTLAMSALHAAHAELLAAQYASRPLAAGFVKTVKDATAAVRAARGAVRGVTGDMRWAVDDEIGALVDGVHALLVDGSLPADPAGYANLFDAEYQWDAWLFVSTFDIEVLADRGAAVHGGIPPAHRVVRSAADASVYAAALSRSTRSDTYALELARRFDDLDDLSRLALVIAASYRKPARAAAAIFAEGWEHLLRITEGPVGDPRTQARDEFYANLALACVIKPELPPLTSSLTLHRLELDRQAATLDPFRLPVRLWVRSHQHNPASVIAGAQELAAGGRPERMAMIVALWDDFDGTLAELAAAAATLHP